MSARGTKTLWVAGRGKARLVITCRTYTDELRQTPQSTHRVLPPNAETYQVGRHGESLSTIINYLGSEAAPEITCYWLRVSANQ